MSLEKNSETTNTENLPEESVQEELVLIDSIKINKNLTMNFYKQDDKDMIIGLDHFNFEDEILIKNQSMKKIMEIFSLYEKEQDLISNLKSKGFNR